MVNITTYYSEPEIERIRKQAKRLFPKEKAPRSKLAKRALMFYVEMISKFSEEELANVCLAAEEQFPKEEKTFISHAKFFASAIQQYMLEH